MAQQFPTQINIPATDAMEAGSKKASVEALLKNLNEKSLEILAKKSALPGINNKIVMYQHVL